MMTMWCGSLTGYWTALVCILPLGLHCPHQTLQLGLLDSVEDGGQALLVILGTLSHIVPH